MNNKNYIPNSIAIMIFQVIPGKIMRELMNWISMGKGPLNTYKLPACLPAQRPWIITMVILIV